MSGKWLQVLRTTVLMGIVASMVTGCGLMRRRDTGPSIDDEPGLTGLEPLTTEEYALGGRFAADDRVTDVQFDNVHFEYDSFQIQNNEVSTIEAVADYLRRNPGMRLVVEGHCDERGSREYNLSLGESRALAVRAYLIGLGIEGGRIQTRSYGEEQPLDPGHTPAAYRRNRRAEFAIYR